MATTISLSNLDGSNGFRLDGVAAGDRLSYADSASSAGDVNGDGFDDLLIGASGADPNGSASGSSYVVYGKASGFAATLNLSSLDGSNGFRLDGVAAYDLSGHPVSSAGDVNGDGFADLLIGSSSTGAGSSYVVFGKASGSAATMDLSSLDGSNGFRLDGVAEGDRTGRSVSSAGDVNGDGFDDLLVGAFRADPNGTNSGSSYVVFGKASGFAATLDLSNLDGSNGFRLNGVARGDVLGFSVSSAGDVNGDGYNDLLVGAFEADPNGISSAGSSYVVFGKASGFAATLNLSSLDGSNGFRLDGVATNDSSGRSVSSAGDVNGDGFDDLLVGANGAGPNGLYSGSSYVVFGKASGFAATLNLSSLDGSNGFRLDGVATNDSSGRSVSSAGDVNGDGFDDLLVGANGAGPNGLYSGSSYVVFGKASGFAATLNLSSLDGSNGFRLDGVAAGDSSGDSVSSAGDVNGDGFDDLLVGASGADPNGSASGSSYVVYGKASGFAATLNLSSLDGSNGFRLDGVAEHDLSGDSVSSAGDVNGDGFDDLLVGAHGADSNGDNSGSSYVVFGGNFNGAVTALGTAGADKLKGSKEVDRFVAGDGNDTLIGHSGADVFHGGAGDDIIEIGDVDFQLADGGAGIDTLKLDRSHLDLNVGNVYGKLSDIEAIDMTGQGHNTLTLTALDVLNLSSTSNTLKVDGNHNDSVVGLSSGWTDGGIADGYHTFANGEALLLVGVQVATDFA
ncbi:beta strand repeat-containing protein [Nitrosomonas communis]|uniref:FG-GAP repeat-containing protein n=1 Tax=Nitrosomonas communis TaxID=44574 RepID=A0A1I4XAW5_9PROT|nr:integrin alpha [Nitrosomonas communis]SFN22646.1 FG-GAP repeat-containing protein [Nitrosomonas communis]